jgi:hypothetical protein
MTFQRFSEWPAGCFYPARLEDTTMKSMTSKMMMAAAALVLAGVASAQTLTAEIPFAFRAGGATMAAGKYRISATGQITPKTITLRNMHSERSILVNPMAPLYTKGDSGGARVVFQCNGGDCRLAEIWSGGSSAYRFATPKSARDKEVAWRSVAVRADNGE